MMCQRRDIFCWHINYEHISFLAGFPEAKTGEWFFMRTFKACKDMLIPMVHFVCLLCPQMSPKNMDFTKEHFQCNTTVQIQS